jgi:hypothetical protein
VETRESNYRAALDVVRAVLEELHQVAVLLLHLLLRQRVHGLQRQQDLERDVGGLAALVLGENESSVDTINNFSIASSGVPIRMS